MVVGRSPFGFTATPQGDESVVLRRIDLAAATTATPLSDAADKSTVTILVSEVSGRPVRRIDNVPEATLDNYLLQIPGAQRGVYFITIIRGDLPQTERVLLP